MVREDNFLYGIDEHIVFLDIHSDIKNKYIISMLNSDAITNT